MKARKKIRPIWDGRRLSFRGEIVKSIKRPSPNQESVLRAFQVLRWVKRIDNPLYGNPERAHERLRDAIKKLNRGQNVLRFRADGTGKGICWDPVEQLADASDEGARSEGSHNPAANDSLQKTDCSPGAGE